MTFDPNYWKVKYATEWKPGTNRVRHALDILKKTFPDLTITASEYALSDKYIPPNDKHKKHDPDVFIKHGKRAICDIEVTGSDIEMTPPNDIFILRGKYLTAKRRKEKDDIDTWFYTVYRGSEYVLDLSLIEKFNGDKAQEKYLKGVPEWYICIPCDEAYSKEKLFEWIAEKAE